MEYSNSKLSQYILILFILSTIVCSKSEAAVSSNSNGSDTSKIEPGNLQNATILDNSDIEYRWVDNFTLPENVSNSDNDSLFASSWGLYRPVPEGEDNETSIFEGDMMTGNLTVEGFRQKIGFIKGVDEGVAAAKSGQDSKWPNAELPYVFGPDCSPALKQTWSRAVDFFKAYTCIVVRPKRANDNEHVFVSQETRSCGTSDVGRIKGFKNELKIGFNCETSLLTVIHEIMHALGFIHEQSRPDRDSYVSIAFDNIIPSELKNFLKYQRIEIDTFSLPYDFFSIMHYTWNAFSISEKTKPTVIAKDAKVIVGQQKFVSLQDITQIKKNYKCPNENSHYNAKCPADKPFKCTKTVGCLPKNLVCNGNNDCGDNSDEQGCSVPQNSQTSALWKIIQDTAVKIVNQKVPPGFASGPQSAQAAETNRTNQDEPEQDTVPLDDAINNCLKCICDVITPGCKAEMGSSCREDGNCGPYQITSTYWELCGQPKPTGKPAGSWQDCALDNKCSISCVKQYSLKYANLCAPGRPPNCETMARVHKGGEFGCRSIVTVPFWNKVETCLETKQKLLKIDN